MEYDFHPHTVYRVVFWMPWLMKRQLYHPDGLHAVCMYVEGFPHDAPDAVVVSVASPLVDDEDQEVDIWVIPKTCIIRYGPKKGNHDKNTRQA